MKSKVTLKEMVGTKIIYAALLACYYWMWARRDWQEFYTTIQHVVVLFTIVFFALRAGRVYQYGRQEKDEQALRDLRRTDALLFWLLAAAAAVVAFASAVAFPDGRTAGYALVGTILVLTILRFLLFCALEGKRRRVPEKR